MFDEPVSLPMRAAIASLLGSLFGIALILSTQSAQAQPIATAPDAPDAPAAVLSLDSGLKRLGDAALHALRAVEPTYALANTGTRGMRLVDSGSELASGLRWQVSRIPGWRSEGDIPRNRDLVSLGVQVRF